MYVLGIDGGGTKTAAVILDIKGNLIGSAIEGPSSIDTVPLTETKKNIELAVRKIIKEDDIKVVSVFAGIGGIISSKQEQEVVDLLRQFDFVTEDATVVAKNDVYNALAGGLEARAGIAIIIGTGSVAFGKDESGNTWRCGGYGHKEGDAGSAYDLGSQALKLLARYIDGRIKGSKFLEELKNELKVHDFVSLAKIINTYERTQVAQLAKIVTKHGDLGDQYALEIIDKATSELALMIKTVDEKLNLKNKEIAVIGSLGNADTVFKSNFISKVKQINPEFNIHKNILEPVMGASLLALKNFKEND